MSYLELVEFYMQEYKLSEEDACRCADLEMFADYNADDYEG